MSEKADVNKITPAMISAGVYALQRLVAFDVAFPGGGEDEVVEAVLRAGLQAGLASDCGAIGPV